MQQKPNAVKNDKVKQVPILVLETLDRRPSNFEKEGSREDGKTIFLDSASQHFILTRSVMLDDEGSLVPIRYIRNARSIYEDDQNKVGTKSNPLTDYIVFEHGVLTVRREGTDIMLYDYLKSCSFNADAPKRSQGVEAIFYEVNAESEAEGQLESFDELVDSMNLLRELRSKGPGGIAVYNEERIEALSTLFNIRNVDSLTEKFNVLLGIATTRPSFYKKMVDDITVSIKIHVTQGRELGVLSVDGDGPSFMETGRVFAKFKAKTVEKRFDELVNYFISKEGEKDYKELAVRIDAAKALQLKSD